MNIRNEIIYHTISFFLKETNHLNFQKISKLIYLFDLAHIRSVGLSATGAKYVSLASGPYLQELLLDTADFKKHFKTNSEQTNLMLIPLFSLDLDVFSPHQLSLLNDIVYKDKNEKNWLINVLHHKNDPWYIFHEIQGQKEKEIPMILAFGTDEASEILKSRFEEMG